MTLSEKILYCRKRCALSQEALAEKIGVSRQAISKWETGEAAPELSKLALLAKTFGVTADWLISEDNPPESAAQGASQKQPSAPAQNANWVDSLPGAVQSLVRRYGWLAGAYIAASGAGMTIIGIIARIAVGKMMSGFDSTSPFGGAYRYGNSFGSFLQNNPVSVMATIMIIIGTIILIAGIGLALYLKNKSNEK